MHDLFKEEEDNKLLDIFQDLNKFIEEQFEWTKKSKVKHT